MREEECNKEGIKEKDENATMRGLGKRGKESGRNKPIAPPPEDQ